MINYLHGTPLFIGSELSVVVGGVGYYVRCPQRTLSSLQNLPECQLYISTRVKEDAFELFGFITVEEKKLFELLVTVSGVGPAMALGIMEKPTQEVIQALKQANVSFFTAVPRVGKKVAQKLIIELTPKLGSHEELNLKPLSPSLQTTFDALSALGIAETISRQAIETLELDPDTQAEQAIAQVLKYLGSQK